MKLNEGAFFAICVVALTIICAGSIFLDYWNANQIRMTSTYGFTGDFTTFLGLIGVVSTAIIIVTAFRRFYRSPLNR